MPMLTAIAITIFSKGSWKDLGFKPKTLLIGRYISRSAVFGESGMLHIIWFFTRSRCPNSVTYQSSHIFHCFYYNLAKTRDEKRK
ncbi:MAG: hypothetical protein PHG79_11970 [Methanosarcina sp.]|nr:hypothetical protein [Methanosarcina sp.]